MVTKKKATAKKTVAKKEAVTKVPEHTHSSAKTDDLLMQNFVGLQKVIVDLSLKLNGLTEQISQLLKLFEMSAETIVKKEFKVDKESNQELMKRLDLITEQNKLVARGFTLMHEKPAEEMPRTNTAPVPFQRTQGNIQPMTAPIAPRQNVQPATTQAPVVQRENTMEVPGSEEEETA